MIARSSTGMRVGKVASSSGHGHSIAHSIQLEVEGTWVAHSIFGYHVLASRTRFRSSKGLIGIWEVMLLRAALLNVTAQEW